MVLVFYLPSGTNRVRNMPKASVNQQKYLRNQYNPRLLALSIYIGEFSSSLLLRFKPKAMFLREKAVPDERVSFLPFQRLLKVHVQVSYAW